MTVEKQTQPMSLEQVLSRASDCARALARHLQSTMVLRLADFHDLSRPIRQRSRYPTFIVMEHGLQRVEEAHTHVRALTQYLERQMTTIKAQLAARQDQDKGETAPQDQGK